MDSPQPYRRRKVPVIELEEMQLDVGDEVLEAIVTLARFTYNGEYGCKNGTWQQPC